MPLNLTPFQIGLRLLLAAAAAFIIGLNRDEKGQPAGVRTTMLVCLAATLAMLQVNLLLPMSGKTPSSFAVMDLMRLPLGILSGIGFIGAGVIVKREQTVIGLTTAATMWYVTVLGLLFGGGQLVLGCVAAAVAVIVLWGLKLIEALTPRERHGRLSLELTSDSPAETELRTHLEKTGCYIARWKATYAPPSMLSAVQCELRWREPARAEPRTLRGVSELRTWPGIVSVQWEE